MVRAPQHSRMHAGTWLAAPVGVGVRRSLCGHAGTITHMPLEVLAKGIISKVSCAPTVSALRDRGGRHEADLRRCVVQASGERAT